MFYLKVASIFLLLCISSCGANKRSLNLYYDENEMGVSSLDVFKKYGPSSQMWYEGDKNIYSYSYSKPKYSFLSFLPIPVFRSKFDNYEVVLTFDGEGKLADVSKFHDRVEVRSWLVCESGVVDCDVDRRVVGRK